MSSLVRHWNSINAQKYRPEQHRNQSGVPESLEQHLSRQQEGKGGEGPRRVWSRQEGAEMCQELPKAGMQSWDVLGAM